ncbi:class B secretin-like G-protein coupled receptor GPRcal3, putative [Pediculus humanus corporis]|uniref:Class B secretin-like G-protein coupled receptor GPRcal3, putative n=1 Tax=Pediculus humanus subsp. corporis TaxID=121224 RepID=E0V9L3_PEDHC|nr:class B secretin-like G-protein coupled receptor GPRcal3, putative [Pediculus humanus corporis]EEB10069.1 class B secretin-like G-protein coupled receptor GPRcal3, putative [Pediculus humanus corporis]
MKNFLFFTFLLPIVHPQGTPFKNENLCRTRNDIYLPYDEFNMDSCVLCYRFMSNYSFKENSPLDLSVIETIMKNHSSYQDLMENETILKSFINSVAVNKWKECCKSASDCCTSMIANKTQKVENWCPRTWDGWLCWPDIKPGNQERKLCPNYVLTNMENCTNSFALKTCEKNGKWAHHPFDKNNEWTNYTPCSAKPMIEKRMYVTIGSYALSVIALVPALIIFQKFRSLRCHRIILHKNLFASLLFHCSTQIAFNSEFILDDLSGNSRISKNELSCKALLVATKYFRLTNYFWMFCEGFYLHRQIVNVFAEEASLTIFYIIVPIIPVAIFIAFRKAIHDTDCWALPSDYIDWALHLPSVKATLVLVPLFGIHFLFTLYRQKSVCSSIEGAYAYIRSTFDGLQGFLVAVIFCYVNSEFVFYNTDVTLLIYKENLYM